MRSDGAPTDVARLRRSTRLSTMAMPIVVSVYVTQLVATSARPAPVIAGMLACVLVCGAGTGYWYLDRTAPHSDRPLRLRHWAAGAAGVALAAGIGMSVARGESGTEWLLPAGCVAGACALAARDGRRLVTIGGAAVIGGGVAFAMGPPGVDRLPTAAAVAGFLAFFGWAVWFQWWNYDVARQLEDARAVAAELAVADERLRFAAELHDIQGHRLQVIALKAELAARAPGAAAVHLRDVQELARDALRDTKNVVSGYRRVTPGEEIGNAAKVLSAAAIDATVSLPDPAPVLAADYAHLLGLLVREATTNLIRHARAAHARIDVRADDDQVHVAISNDGVAGAAESTIGAGTGLAGLSRRFESVGGNLCWERRADEFTVTGRLPLGVGPE